MNLSCLKISRGRLNRSVQATLFMIVAASLACSLPFGGGSTPTPPPSTETAAIQLAPPPTPQPLPPALVESDPLPGADLPLEGPITLYFNQAMDHASVEGALSGSLQQGANFAWPDDSTVVIYAAQPFSADVPVSLNMSASAFSSQGMGLSGPVNLSFRTAGPLRLAQTLPDKGAGEVDPTSAVVATFNRPVVPLGADPAGLPAAFSLDPTPSGHGEWINTSTYIFYPEPGLAGGLTYTVNMDASLKSVDGSLLQDTQPWSFSTAFPALLTIDPDPASPWPLDTKVSLTFNQAMDPASVQANFALTGPAGPVAGQPSWNEDGTVFTFTPAVDLARSTSYTVSLSGATQALGGTPLGSPVQTPVLTAPPLAVIRSDPGQAGQMDPQGNLTLFFSAPIQEKDVLTFISLDPAVPNLNEYWNAADNSLLLNGNFSPNTAYNLTLLPGLLDAWNGALSQPFSLSFSTASLRPDILVLPGGDATFVTVAESNIIVQATNIAELPLTVGGLSFADFFASFGLQGYDYRQGLSSSDQRSWTQPLNTLPDRSQAIQVPLSPGGGTLSPGLYFLRFDLNQDNIFKGPFVLVVSNLQVTYKFSATDVLVWAVDLRDNSPVADAPVNLYNTDGSILTSGVTDSQGVMRASLGPLQDPYQLTFAMVGQPGEDRFGMALSSWSQGIEPWTAGLAFNPQPPGLKAYIYTDRPIYRPGQKVYFRAVARQAYNGRYQPPEVDRLPVELSGSVGEILTRLNLFLDGFGTGHGEFDLPDDAQPGYYNISSYENVNGTILTYGSIGFQVANYRKPEINLQVSFAASQVLAGSDLTAQVNARYFFDAPAGNVPVHYVLYARNSSFDLTGYHVGVEDTSWLEAFRLPSFEGPLGASVLEGDATTGPDGTLSIQLPTTVNSSRRTYTLEVTATDESGLPVSGRASAEADPADFFIGVRPDAWYGRAGDLYGVEVAAVDWDKHPAGAQNLRAEFNKVTWTREDPVSSSPDAQPRFIPQYTLVGSTDFSTSQAGLARLAFTPPDPGTYQLNLISPGGARTELIVWVAGTGQAIWPDLPNGRLKVSADQETYQPGDTAQIFIPNPFGREAQALITVERSVVIQHQVTAIGPEGANLPLPLTADYAPNVILSVTLLGTDERGRTNFRQGYLNIPVKPVEQTLRVTLASQPGRAGPGDQVTFDVLVSDSRGNPVQGEFSLAVVDLAALALADPNSPDIVPAFYDIQPGGVRTCVALAASTQYIAYFTPGLGGGGGAEAISVTRQNFPDTAYWNAEVVTDADGKASVTITLPDTLTTWHVDLRGLTLDTLVGQAVTEVVTTKELLVRPEVPRFLVVGDHLQLAAIAQNNTQNEMQVQVSLDASPFSLDDPSTRVQTVSLPAGGRSQVVWWGTVGDAKQADLVFSVSGTDTAGNSFQDAARPPGGKLPIRRYLARQAFHTSGTLTEGGGVQELVSLPRSFSAQGGSLNLELSPSLAAAMLKALDVLEHDPYESTETTLSRFLPNLETYRVFQGFSLDSPEVKDRLDRTLPQGLLQLMSRQNFDGGWGWWQGSESDIYITSYVVYGLARARQAGITVDDSAFQRAVDFIQANLPAADASALSGMETWQLDRLCFEYYALTEAGFSPNGNPSDLFQARDRLSPWAGAFLALTLERLTPDSAEAKTLLDGLSSQAVQSAAGAHWEVAQTTEGGKSNRLNMHDTLSTSAVVVYALAQRDPGSPLLAEAVRYLMAHRGADGGWSSSYASAWTLIALAQVMQGTGELGGDFGFSAALNGAPLAQGRAGAGAGQLTNVTSEMPLGNLYPDYPNSLTIQRDPGPGRLYYSASLDVSRAVEQVTPLSQGLSLRRSFYQEGASCPAGGECAALQSTPAGSKVTVRLTLTLPQDVYFLAVEDYIPAGTEILDTRLKTTQQGQGEEPEVSVLYDPRDPYAKGWGWWLFHQSQIYDDHITWTADYLPAGSYELSYTLVALFPGQYRALPARAWELYFPEVQANSAGAVFEIKP